MGTPEAARIFTEALVSGLGAVDDDGGNDAGASASSFDALALRGLTVIHSTSGRVLCRMPVTREKSNRYGTLHGGCAATLVDVCGTAAIVSVSEQSGVSLHISVDYLSPAPVGNRNSVFIESKVVKVGRTIATANVEIYSEVKENDTSKRVLIAQGTHIKHVGSSDASRVRQQSPPPRARL